MAFHPITIVAIPGFCEPFSSLSHLLGALLVLAFSWSLLRRGWGRPGHLLALSLFAATALLCLSMSGVYHLLPLGTERRALFCRLDHAAIFALIAGSFTPPHIILFRGWWRWGVLLLVWALAAVGITLTTLYLDVLPEWLTLACYLGMGWIGAISAARVWRHCGFELLRPIVWGAAAYTLGALIDFARWPILIPGVVEGHELFHLAVLAGLAWHWSFMQRIADGRVAVIGLKEAQSEAEAGFALRPEQAAP